MWNARGLGGKRAFLFLQQLVADLKPLMLFVSESKVSCKRAYAWLNVLNFNGVLGYDPVGTKGGLLFFWKNCVNINLRSFSANHIDVSVAWESLCWRFTGVYAPPIPEDRMVFWDLLIKLHSLKTNQHEPWLIGGDFNDFLFESEKLGGNKRRGPCANMFRECCHKIGVLDITTSGPK